MDGTPKPPWRVVDHLTEAQLWDGISSRLWELEHMSGSGSSFPYWEEVAGTARDMLLELRQRTAQTQMRL